MTTTGVVVALRAAGIPEEDVALVESLAGEQRSAAGVPADADHERMIAAAALAGTVLGPEATVIGSPLGIGWSGDLDVVVPRPPDPAQLLAAGWICLDGLLAALGSPARRQWAVVHEDEVLARVDLSTTPPAGPERRLLDRCERLGQPRLREVLEARVLHRAGVALPGQHPGLGPLLALDRSLGGSLHRTAGQPELRRGAVLRRSGRTALRPAVRWARRRRVGLSLSGCDGAGKSTLARGVVVALERLGIPVTVAWTRPGMRVGALAVVARAAKRVLRQPQEPGIRAVGRGSGQELASRRGAIGWLWTALVSASFLRDVWGRTTGRRGVVIFDRHALDATVTLGVVYPGVDTRLQQWATSRLLPRADVALLVDVDPEIARARKEDDLFELPVLAEQVARYRAGARAEGLQLLDGTSDPARLTVDALRQLAEGVG